MKNGFIVTFLILFVVGCGSTSNEGAPEFATSNELANAQKYKESIDYLMQAIKKSPKNKEYIARLEQIKGRFLSQATLEVENLLTQRISKSSLDAIDRKLQGLTSVGISSEKTQSLKSKTEVISKEFYKDLKIRYSDLVSLMDQQNWAEAFIQMKEISSRYENYEDINTRKNTIESNALKSYVRAANKALNLDDFEVAQASVDNLMLILPNNPIAVNLNKKLKDIDRPQYFKSKAKNAFDRSDWRTVVASCEKAKKYASNMGACTSLMDTAKQNLAIEIKDSIDSTIKEGRLFSAEELYQQLLAMKTLDRASETSLKNNLIRNIQQSVDTYKKLGNYSLAWHLLQLIEKLDRNFPGLVKDIRDVEDVISERSMRSIAVFDFVSPPQTNNSGVIVANNLITKLFNNASSDIRILERDSLKSIAEEMKISQSTVISERSAKEMGQEYGIDYAIIGSVLLFQVDESTSKSSKSVRYKIGEKISDNIEYLNWKATNPTPSKKELLAAPKAKIMVPEYGQKDYEVTQSKKVGFIQLSYRIVDVITGENTRVETMERKLQVSDTSNAGVSEAGIEFNEMEIATDTEILQNLTEEIVENMATEILMPLQQLETFFLNAATDKEKRQEKDEAIQNYTYAIFNEKLKSASNSPVTETAKVKIANMLADFRFKTSI